MSTGPLFEKILVANRGEIALRIMKTLKKMAIKSVAVYSEVDANERYVEYADEACYIGNSSSTKSYLSIKNIILAAKESGAQAVHPGYGFLSENANFANSLKREGIILIGPSAKVIKSMGDKIEAKKIAIDSGVSTVPGYMGIIHSLEQAIEIAEGIGFPVIIKATAGGGGRGMRVVNNALEMEKAYKSAKFEAENSFSDDRVFIEKLILAPRHIEIQVIADQHGNIVCLGERECSIQRHHQKIIEEAPSTFIDSITRNKMYKEVVSLAKKVNYYSVGTVEFMMDSNRNYYFLEMNTRLQVEHPVTELITGIDLVEQMVRIAATEKLSFSQEDIKFSGWAIECRICAEDPLRAFLPSSGRIIDYQEPPKSDYVRVDSGIRHGAEVSMYYDTMIAKLCIYSDTREDAIKRMGKALSSFVIQGISHNISFLEALIHNHRFISGDINTEFIEEEYPEGFSGATITSEITEVFLSTALFIYMAEQERAASIPGQIMDQINNLGTRWVVSIEDYQISVIIKKITDGYNIRYENNRISIKSTWNIGNHLFSANISGRKVNVKVKNINTGYKLTYSGVTVSAYVRSPRLSELESLMLPSKVLLDNSGPLVAPLSGQIIMVNVKEGDKVVVGQNLFTLTAMKMENIITADRDGKVDKVLVLVNENVTVGQTLLEYEE